MKHRALLAPAPPPEHSGETAPSETDRPLAHDRGSAADFPRAVESTPQDATMIEQPGQTRQRPAWPSIALLLLALTVVAALAWWLLRETPAAAQTTQAAAAPLELAAVDVVVVEPRVLTRLLPLSGSLTPVVHATVKTKVAGEIEALTVREGQDVRAGDVIARLDTRNLQAEYDRESAAVDKARADLDLAQLNREKNRALLEQKFISRNTFEATESAYAASVASLKLAEAQARLARIHLDDAVIRAPFDGAIARRLVQPGEQLTPDAPVVSLVDLRQLVLEAAVPAADIPAVRVGQQAQFRVSGFGGRTFEGHVERINPATAEGSRAIAIYIAVPNPDRALKGGMFAQGELTLDATQPVLAAPVRAVREEAGAYYVFTLQNGKVVRTPVNIGPMIEGQAFVEVRQGLREGQRVIVAEISENKAGSAAFVRGENAPDQSAEASSS